MDPRVQEAFYNGWCKCHGLKYLTFELPFGMTAFMYGPNTQRHNDLWFLRHSNFNAKMQGCQAGNAEQYKAYGDAIFPTLSHLRVRHPEGGTPGQRLENEINKKTRESVEWAYMVTCMLWGYVDWRKNNKVLAGGANIGKVYVVATLLRNCHVCLNGSITSEYFNLVPPELEQFLGVV
jgi:hypothetical protein